MATIKLFESWLKDQLNPINEAEGTAYLRTMDENEKAAVALAKDNTTAAGFTGYGSILQFLKANEILFNISQEEAADWILLGYIRLYAGNNWLRQPKIDGKWIERVKKDLIKWGSILNQISEKVETNMAIDNIDWTEYQFNQNAKNKNNINTLGKITVAGLDQSIGQAPSDSNLEEVCKYVNTYNLVNNVFVSWETSTGYEYGMPEIVNDKNSSTNGYLDFKGGTFVDMSARKNKIIKSGTTIDNETDDIYFWSLKGYKPDITKTSSAVTPEKKIVIVGNKLEPDPIEAKYAPLMYMPAADSLNQLLEVLTSAQKVGTITDLVVYGSASTETINMGNAKQAETLLMKWRGEKQPGANNMLVNELPLDAVINGAGAVGVVKDPKASGNAFLATLRANQIATFLSSKGFTVSQKIAQITSGTDAARFIKVSFNVKQPDNNTIIPAQTVLKTVESLGGTKDYAAIFKCKVADIDLW
jgi:hypothetical protein